MIGDWGTCYRCGGSWEFLPHHTTEYNDRNGCFPLCETCWTDLTPETRLEFYRRLWVAWGQWPDPTTDRDEQWRQIEAAVLAGG